MDHGKRLSSCRFCICGLDWFPSASWSFPEPDSQKLLQDQQKESEISECGAEESCPDEGGGQHVLQGAELLGSAKDELLDEASTANGKANVHGGMSELEPKVDTLTAHNAMLLEHEETNAELKATSPELEAYDEVTSPVVHAISSKESISPGVGSCESDHRVKIDFPKKYLFLARHAQSLWNDKTNHPHSIFLKDHPITTLGEKQAADLRSLIMEEYQKSPGSRDPSEQVFYDALFQRCGEEQPLYSSPMLRALQTAHLCFPIEAGWSKIVLLRDAREVRQSVAERDNAGEVVGSDIDKRAMESCKCAPGTPWKDVDHSDCNDAWWSDHAESEEGINCRLQSLVHRLLETDPSKSRVCVMHSNLIMKFLMRFGSIDGPQTELGLDSLESEPCDSDSASFTQINYEPGLLQRAKTNKLMNCGMIGLMMEREDNNWVVKEACLMFGSRLRNHVDVEAGCE